VTAADRAARATMPVHHEEPVELARAVDAHPALRAARAQPQHAADPDTRDEAIAAQHESIAALERVRPAPQPAAAQELEAGEEVLQHRHASVDRGRDRR
jgi:hypothetical protein